MARDSSSGPPPPLMGVVCLLLLPVLSAVPLFPPHSCFVLWWGALDDMLCPLPSPPAGLAQGARVADQGVPPLPLLVMVSSPPPSPEGLERGARIADRLITPPLPSPGYALWERNTWSGCLPLSPGCVRVSHASGWGMPLLLCPLAARWGSVLNGWGVPL